MVRTVTHRFLILVCSVLFLFLSVGMTRGERGVLTGPEAWIKSGVAWLQGWLYRPVASAVSALGGKSAGKGAADAEMMELKSRIYELERENRELRKLLGYRDEPGVTYIPARVVYRNPDRWTGRIAINRGTEDGVQPRMLVVTADGLIGRVQAVTATMADVRLLTDTGSGPGIAAAIQHEGSEILGIIEGYDSEKGCLIMRKVPVTAKPKPGDIVVTSRLSEIFPGGVLIGEVKEVKPGDYGVDQSVYVKPSASFEQLDMVMVVRDPAKLQLQKLGGSKPDAGGNRQ
jgi:rod shape-determining protein MreC